MLLRPGISIPGRKQVADPPLDEIYKTDKEKIAKCIQGNFATLSIDGWSNVTTNPIIGLLCQQPTVLIWLIY